MELKIIIDESLPEMNGRISDNTFNQLRELRGINLFNGDNFQLGDLQRPTAIISVSSELDVMDNILYVDPELKSAYYANTTTLTIE